MKYSFRRKELNVQERVIAANASNARAITNVSVLNDEIAVEYIWEQVIKGPNIMNAINGDKSKLYAEIRQAILNSKKE